jgi:HEAT repeat protein
MGTKQRTIAILVLVVSLVISGCEQEQASAVPLLPTPIPSTPTQNPTQEPAQAPTATLAQVPVPTNTSEPSPANPAPDCPGGPYSLNATDYTLPAGISPKLKSLIQDLSSPDPVARVTAIASIKGSGEEAVQAIPFLVVLSKDETPLKWHSGFSTTPGKEAINALADIKGECAFLALKTIAENGDQVTLNYAVQALGNSDNPDALKILYDLLHDTNFEVRFNAVYALGTLISNQVYDDNSLENLMAVAINNNESDDIRIMAEKDIGLLGINLSTSKDQAMYVLLLLTKDPKPSIRSGTAQVLRDFNDPKVIETLISMLRDENSLVAFYAADSLTKITGKDFGKDYGEWDKWWKSQN